MRDLTDERHHSALVTSTLETDRGDRLPERFPGSSAGSLMGELTMSTNASTIHHGSIQYGRAGLAALLGALVLAAAALLALQAGPPTSGTAPNGASDAAIQRALIDVRAGERASLGVASDADVQRALIDVRAGERASLGVASDADVQRALIDVRAGERASRGVAVPSDGSWVEFRAGH
jgi:hypothetical protein